MPSSTDHGATLIGSGTKTNHNCAFSQLTLHCASCEPVPTHWKSNRKTFSKYCGTNRSSIGVETAHACLTIHHFDIQSTFEAFGYLFKFIVTAAAYPRLFEIRSLGHSKHHAETNHIMSTLLEAETIYKYR